MNRYKTQRIECNELPKHRPFGQSSIAIQCVAVDKHVKNAIEHGVCRFMIWLAGVLNILQRGLWYSGKY
jgi:hypothetical protein